MHYAWGIALLALLFGSAAGLGDVVHGTWTEIVGGGDTPPARTWHTCAADAGRLYVLGGATPQDSDTYAFDTKRNTWRKLPVKLDGAYTAADADMVGGLLTLFGGANQAMTNTIQVLDVISGSQWYKFQAQNAPPERNGHSFTAFGGAGVVFGGWDAQTYYNDMWGFCVSCFVNPGPAQRTATWVQYLPNDPDATDRPAPRNSHSMVAYGSRMYLFGGFQHNTDEGVWTNCDKPNSHCVFFNDLWVWTPPEDLESPCSQGGYCPWASINIPSDQYRPSGRFEHAATVLGSYMYIFGGRGSNGQPLSDLWRFDFRTSTWGQVVGAGDFPPPSSTPAGAVIGGSLYFFSGSTTTSSLYRFTPIELGGSVPKVQCNCQGEGSCSLGGPIAGIVLLHLLAIGNLVFVFFVWLMLRKGKSTEEGYAAM